MLTHVPQSALKKIKKHLSDRVMEAERNRGAFMESNEEYVTSAILERLAENQWQKAGGVKWRIQVYKTGNYGVTAESKIGADGLIQIKVYDKKSGKLLETKGLLFQAKKTSYSNKKKLEQQITKMENTAGQNGCAVFIYDTDSGFSAQSTSEVDYETLWNSGNQTKLNKYLSNEFLDCKVGSMALSYDRRKGILFTPEEKLPVQNKDNLNVASIVVER
jgi:hypothetical protein